MRYRRTTRSGSGSRGADDRVRDKQTAARSVPRRQSRDRTDVSSRAPRQQPGGPDEHHDDEERERQHIAPFEIREQSAEREDLGKHESRDEAANEIAEPPEYADQKRDRSERQAD